MQKTATLIYFILLCSLCPIGQVRAQNLDSLISELTRAKEAEKVELALKISEMLMLKAKDSALMYAKQAERLAIEDSSLLKAYLQTAEIYNNYREGERALPYMGQALVLVKKPALAHKIGDVFSKAGNTYFSLVEYDKAIEMYYQAYEWYKAHGDEEGVAATNGHLAMLYSNTGDYEQARKMHHAFIVYLKRKKDYKSLVRSLYNLSFLHNKVGANDSCVLYAQEMIDLSYQIQSPFAMMKGYTIGGNAHIKLKNYEKAQIFMDSANMLANQLNVRVEKATTKMDLGYLAYYQGQYDEAIAISESLIGSSEILRSSPKDLAYKAYKAKGELSKALPLAEWLIHYKDSIRKAEVAQKIASLQAKYESEKKEAEIKTLSQEAKIKDLELAKRNQWLLSGGLAVLLLGGLGIFLSQKRSAKAKANQAELEQRFLRSQLNPHFMFNALASIQNYMLKNETKQAGLYLSKFGKLMRQVLENSREQFIPLSEEIKMLENYMELQKLQPQANFSYEITLDEEIVSEEFAIPPMFVQPFVENAIEHGVIQGNGEIGIYFQKSGDLVSICITDNGVGLSQKQLVSTESAKTHTSLATSIIKERIESYNQKLQTNIQLLVSEMLGQNKEVLGTKVELKVPFQLAR